MELSKQELNNKLKEAVNQGYIQTVEAGHARKIFKQNGDTEILQTIEVRKEARMKAKGIMNTKWQDLSEVEALQRIVSQNDTMISTQKEIKGWVTFFGIVTIIGLIGAVISSLISSL